EGTRSTEVELDIYISTAGQADIRHRLYGHFPDFQLDWAPGPEGKAHFEGGALLAESEDLAGTWQVSITFDPGYGSCHATVISRRDDVTELLKRLRSDLPSYKDIKVLSAESSAPACSVSVPAT